MTKLSLRSHNDPALDAAVVRTRVHGRHVLRTRFSYEAVYFTGGFWHVFDIPGQNTSIDCSPGGHDIH